MDVYESARAQLGEFITFEALRIFDPETMQVVQEKRQAGFPIRFPSLTPAQAQEHLRLCLSTGKPLLHFIHEKEHLCLLVETPFQQSGKIRLLALMTDMTDHVFLNAAGPNDEKGLVNELRRLHRQNNHGQADRPLQPEIYRPAPAVRYPRLHGKGMPAFRPLRRPGLL